VERLQSRKQFVGTIKKLWRDFEIHKSKRKFRTWFQHEKHWYQGEVDEKGEIDGLHVQIDPGNFIIVAYILGTDV
jgi:hypothetical protein